MRVVPDGGTLLFEGQDGMRVAAAILALALCGCTPLPTSYPVPEQRPLLDGPEPGPLEAFVPFADSRTPDYLLEGFLDAAPGQTWRWTGKKAFLKVRLGDVENLHLVWEFALPEESYRPLLPVTVTYWVNEKVAGKVTYAKAGVVRHVQPVEPALLVANGENRIGIEMDKVYVAPEDKAELGMVVSGAGFEVRK
jgi:hypothetical protein